MNDEYEKAELTQAITLLGMSRYRPGIVRCDLFVLVDAFENVRVPLRVDTASREWARTTETNSIDGR
jgi:hypothetical protein